MQIDERMQDMMVDLRGKFKAICARLGLPEQLQLAVAGLSTEVAGAAILRLLSIAQESAEACQRLAGYTLVEERTSRRQSKLKQGKRLLTVQA